jgi:hypothetical protein
MTESTRAVPGIGWAAAVAAALALFAAALGATPASATVHEITGMACSDGHAMFGPPGITGQNGNSHRGEANFALPLFATGFATFDPTGGPDGDPLISFDDSHPASKVILTGEVVEIEPDFYVTEFEFVDLPCPGDDPAP